LVGNTFYKNGRYTGSTLAVGGDINSASALILDGTDSNNWTTFGNEGTGIAGCTFTSCDATHAFTEIFVNDAAGDFHLRTAPPISPAIDRGTNSFTLDDPAGGAVEEWVPATDFEGTARPQDGD